MGDQRLIPSIVFTILITIVLLILILIMNLKYPDNKNKKRWPVVFILSIFIFGWFYVPTGKMSFGISTENLQGGLKVILNIIYKIIHPFQ